MYAVRVNVESTNLKKKKKVQSKELFGISQVQSEILKILSP